LRPPVSRSQYVPGAKPVGTVTASVVPSRLIATNPLLPRENAIAFAPSSHQLVTSVPATVRRKRTMLRRYGSRCSHTQSPNVAVSRLEAQRTGSVHPFASDGGPIEFPDGQTNAKLERIDG